MSDVVLEKVSRHFGDFVAVNDVDLRVAQGEFVTRGVIVTQAQSSLR